MSGELRVWRTSEHVAAPTALGAVSGAAAVGVFLNDKHRASEGASAVLLAAVRRMLRGTNRKARNDAAQTRNRQAGAGAGGRGIACARASARGVNKGYTVTHNSVCLAPRVNYRCYSFLNGRGKRRVATSRGRHRKGLFMPDTSGSQMKF